LAIFPESDLEQPMLAFYLPILISRGILEVLQANMSASGSLAARRKQAKPTLTIME
jgi:hypothetical protein